ncbi:DPH6 [Hepatospora eriocheir]|uniref:Diphthine--ammonia ligase n=1 Tax=Hepatospora eriocheir TaxID=1081669 RepID=A0A1X0QBA9_9MICR|nr:DPH6 [Hepatospora eriocheir]
MKFAALVSGGKDSVYAIKKLIEEGNDLVALIHMYKEGNDFTDSFMYQTVGSEIASLFGEVMGVPLFKYKTSCKAINKELTYNVTNSDEVEDLFNAVSKTLDIVKFEGISSGAIASTYQKLRVESICERLNIKSLAPLWGVNQKELIEGMISSGLDARIVKIASPIFNKSNIGNNLIEIYEHVKNNSQLSYDKNFNFCGEGGEFESVVFDCKDLFIKRIDYEDLVIENHPEDDNKLESNRVYYGVFKNPFVINK